MIVLLIIIPKRKQKGGSRMKKTQKEKLVQEGVDIVFDYMTEVGGLIARNFFVVAKEAEERCENQRKEATDRCKERLTGLISQLINGKK